MADAELMYRPATELAAMVRAGEISAQELVTCSLERIDELNPTINAFIDVFADEALAEAIFDGVRQYFVDHPPDGSRFALARSTQRQVIATADDAAGAAAGKL